MEKQCILGKYSKENMRVCCRVCVCIVDDRIMCIGVNVPRSLHEHYVWHLSAAKLHSTPSVTITPVQRIIYDTVAMKHLQDVGGELRAQRVRAHSVGYHPVHWVEIHLNP